MAKSDSKSGMLLLQESYNSLSSAPSPDIQFWDPAIPVAESVAKEAARIASLFVHVDKYDTHGEQVSPFILHLFYCSQAIYWEKARTTGDESAVIAVDNLTKALKIMDDRRWKVAGESLPC
jgi:hypothetical protein